jgi:aryl-alcohol dehydrogenase-like predicted oxidoreductase
VRDGYIRDGQTGLDRQNIRKALEGSLKRLGVDYIDLYQAHWPDRKVNMFGERGYTHEQNDQSVDLAETLEAMQELQKEGKIRYFGVSNETPWGVMKYLELHKDRSLPRVVTIQNNYSLLTRTYDTHLAEVSHREDVGLLAYSPLGFGVLGGRYLDGRLPKGGRFTKYPYFAERYRSAEVEKIIKKYLVVAKKHNLSLAKLALAFVYSRPFVTSNIIGPSNPEQLIECVEALDIKLNSEILADIETVHEECPNPCP